MLIKRLVVDIYQCLYSLPRVLLIVNSVPIDGCRYNPAASYWSRVLKYKLKKVSRILVDWPSFMPLPLLDHLFAGTPVLFGGWTATILYQAAR